MTPSLGDARTGRPTRRALTRFDLDPAAYCHPEWIPSGVRRFAEGSGHRCGAGHGRAAMSAMLLDRYRLGSAFDTRLLEGARRLVLLSPACFETVLVLAGVMHHREEVARSLDARLFRALHAAAPGVDIMAVLDRAGGAAQASAASSARVEPLWPRADSSLVAALTAAGERALARAASTWGDAVSDRVRLRLRRASASRRPRPGTCEASPQVLESRLEGCIASLEVTEWL